MTIGVLDLSIVTSRLIQEVEDARDATRLWDEEPPHGVPLGEDEIIGHEPSGRFHFEVTGLPPHEARLGEGCQVSLYLFHVAPDATYRNTFPLGGRPRVIPEQPFALTLHYLLSAHSQKSYIEEQQAMSIALKCLHDHPIMRAVVPLDPHRVQEFTLTMETEGVDEVGRLWLSFATPLRLCAVYRASVIFLEPDVRERPRPGVVLRPVVLAEPDCPPVAERTPFSTETDTVTITGDGFDETTISLTIGELAIPVVPSPDPPGPGEASVVSATSVELRFPEGTQRGRYVLRVRLTPESPVEEVELELLRDVP
jgi:Pvc16 N-terminal domain